MTSQGNGYDYEEAGSGTPVLLLVHGTAGDRSHLERQFEHFRASHRVVAVDLRGRSVRELRGELEELCGRLALGELVVVGHSVGGIVALELAIHAPARVIGIVLLDAPIFFSPATAASLAPFAEALRGEGRTGAIRDFFGSMFAAGGDPERKERILRELVACPRDQFDALWAESASYDARSAAAKCPVPALFVQSAVPADLAEMALAFPRLAIERLETAGHYAQLEAPERVNRAIERFLGTLMPRST